jgi:predicted P-loop ATPase
VPYGSKDPTGIIGSFKHDWSRDPAQWAAWYAQHRCNFGVVGFASNLIIVDIDTKGDGGREEAWALWSELCTSWGLPAALAPHVQSARGGWHVYCAVPPGVDAATLRQPDAIKKRINVRCVGYVIAAGSYYDGTAKGEESGHYLLMGNAAPHPAPAALVAHCTRRAAGATTSGAGIGTTDPAAIRSMLEWMTAHGAFEAYEDWLAAGMVAKLELGDAGLEAWRVTHDDTVTPDVEATKWNSFAADASSANPDDLQKIGTLFDRAKKMGYTGNLRASAAYMFRDVVQTDVFGKPVNVNPAPAPPSPTAATVAAIAQAAGASLPPPQSIPLADTQRIIAALGQPILDSFLTGTSDTASRSGNPIELPESLAAHPLHDLLNESISRALAMAEANQFRQSRVLPMLAVLYAVHQTVCENVTHRITALGGALSPGSLDSAVKNFEWRVRVETNTAAGFILDSKGRPSGENSDNVHVFVRQRALRTRWNVWKDIAEVADDSQNFEPLTDHVFGDLFMDAENSQFDYHPSEGRFRRGLISNARRTMYDPLLERIDTLAAKWDGVPRLDTWLTHAVHVPADAYHVAVGRNIIGGMIARARRPGCQHAEAAVFISPEQGTGKSTLTKILALEDDWHTDSLKLGGRQQDIIPQMAGKWVVELGELAGMNNSEVEDVKQFMSTTNDNYTKKYEAFAADHPRRCVFIGTSNSKRPLRDESGNRRFLPVHVIGEVDLEWLRTNVEQLIGEAAVRDSRGETFGIPREVWDEANHHQEAARAMTPVEELCYEWFDRPTGSYFITAGDLNHAIKLTGQKGRYASFMDKMGWRSGTLLIPDTGRKSRVWYKHTNDNLAECIRLAPAQPTPTRPVEMRMLPPGQTIIAPPY